MMSSNPDWNDYHEYVSLRERGLRREAFQRLNRFLNFLVTESFNERRDFVCWLFSENENIESLAHPLKVKIVEPLLKEWINCDPNDFRPHLWLGTIPHLWEAHRLAPDDQDIRWCLALNVLRAIQYEVHELPIGFLGDDPEGSYTMLLRLRRLLVPLSASDRPRQVWAEIESIIEILGNYLDYQRDPKRHPAETFSCWCERLARRGR
ncbi:hypothetical protein [Microvirga sp. BSC39]|uniref:hypothetical protein n=1 Tax=Microvirga sp. BSC39 TaxID=1549810 RepID=UPI001269897F|nr:hypothetical protein [Microvirga sp. BSC39]